MHKIYSRPRIRIPKIVIHSQHKMSDKNSKKMTIMLIILVIAFSTVKVVLDAVNPIYDTLCENQAKSIATRVSNEQAAKIMKEYSYEELFTIGKDTDGKVSMINANVLQINLITSQIANQIQQQIDTIGRDDIQIALRKFHRN